MKKTILSIVAVLLLCVTVVAQNVQKSVIELTSKTDAKITLNQTFGIAEFVKFPNDNALAIRGNTVYEKSISFLETYKDIFNLKTVENAFTYDITKTDQYGFKHVVLLQTHQGVPIFDGKLKFHFNADDKLTAINGNYIPNIKVNPVPSLSLGQASSIAIETITNQAINYSGKPLQAKESTLYVFQKGLVQGYRGSNYLVYRIEVANDNDVREFVFVDAHNGNIIEQFTGIAHAIDRVLYEGDTSNTVWQEGDVFPGALNNAQQNLVVASNHTYNFFNNTFGYVSYDGADIQMQIISNDPTINCPNANWNGSTINFCNGTATDDVVGHEWGHAYTEYTSGLVYAYQSGAINESYSDIWGETIDLINNYEDGDEDLSLRTDCDSSDRWMLGEDSSGFGGAIRDMWDPTCKNHPGKVTDSQYWCASGDSGGVHINSGVPNHAFALLVDGGTYNGQTITGIGLTKAAHIFWRAQSQYLTFSSDFESLADALEASCSDLQGVNLESLSTESVATGPSDEIITASDCDQVINALIAVELRADTGCPSVITILEPLANELCDEAINNPIFFEDWEAGFGSWTLEEVPENPSSWITRNWIIFNGTQANRSGNLAFGQDGPLGGDCVSNLQNGIISLTTPVITMPNDTDATFEMAFNHAIAIDEGFDGANIKYSLDGNSWTLLPITAFIENPYNTNALRPSDNPLSGQPAFTGEDIGTFLAWGTSVIDLSVIGVEENSTIQFRFEVGTDGCDGYIGWALDEIMIYNCGSLSVNEFALENAIKAYPNPSNGHFTLQKTSSINLSNATIYDINGRQIKSFDLESMGNSRQIDISHVASGMYFMRIVSNQTAHVIKLIKK